MRDYFLDNSSVFSWRKADKLLDSSKQVPTFEEEEKQLNITNKLEFKFWLWMPQKSELQSRKITYINGGECIYEFRDISYR